jgi:hypothetical protein
MDVRRCNAPLKTSDMLVPERFLHNVYVILLDSSIAKEREDLAGKAVVP